jgi:hypothetical protein
MKPSSKLAPDYGQAVRRLQGLGVVLAKHSPGAGQGLLNNRDRAAAVAPAAMRRTPGR